MRISVVMRTMNEESAIAKVLSNIREVTGNQVEIITVDSSTDKTPEIAKNLGVKVIKQKLKGPGIALGVGLLATNGEVILTADCDDTYPMEDIPWFVKLIEEKALDITSGNRMNRVNRTMPVLNKFGNWFLAFLVRHLYGIKSRDVVTGTQTCTREIVHFRNRECNYAFPAEIVIRSSLTGYKYKEVNINYRERIGGVTLNKLRSGKAYLRCIFKRKFNLPIREGL